MAVASPGQALGVGLVAGALAGLLALLWPDFRLTAPLARVLTHMLGWLAGFPLAWAAVLGIFLVAEQLQPRGLWRWAAAGGALMGLLTLGALDPQRPPGLLGETLRTTLRDVVGPPGPILGGGALAALGVLATAGVRPDQVWRLLAPLGPAAWRLLATLGPALWRLLVPLGPALLRVLQLALHDLQLVGRRLVREGARRVRRPVPAQAPQELAAPASVEEETVDAAAPAPPKPAASWKPPPVGILAARKAVEPASGHLKDQARIIEETLASFSIEARVLEINEGPAVTQFGVEPAIGVAVSRITARINDLALRLGATPIRIEAPVAGRRMLGIEVPKSVQSLVGLRETMESEAFARSKAQIPLALGKDIGGKPVVADLARMPHLLIAGATGSGKSVCINALVGCLLSQFTPDGLQIIMIDPKMVELVNYNGIPHLRMPVVTETDRTVATLKWATQEMERRYRLFAAHTVRNIDAYNRLAGGRSGERPLPYLVIIIDELADLMMTAPEEVEKTVCRLAQLARATGIHLIVATQRPSVDVVTGLIKANFPSRISFAVTSQIDSRVILDAVGAERLLGRGDMLYLPSDSSKLVRIQGTFVSDEEIEALVTYWKAQGFVQYDEGEMADVETLAKPSESAADELYERAVELAQRSGRISVSYLQRRLGIGYPRAARLMDLLEERGVVAPGGAGRSRDVMVQGELPD